VFAIALTLLVVSVRIEPGVTDAGLPQALRISGLSSSPMP